MSLDDLFGNSETSEEKKELRLIIKADVQGSIEAIEHSLSGINSDKVDLKILAKGDTHIDLHHTTEAVSYTHLTLPTKA